MGSETTSEVITPKIHRPFNSPLESGLRSLFILAETGHSFYDLKRLVYYDYLLVHSGDVPNGPESIHPSLPHRSGELLVRRQIVSAGLDLMFSKELIVKQFTEHGIIYGSTDLTVLFINHLSSNYAEKLKIRAKWINQKFRDLTDEQLSSYIESQIDRWGTEFKLEAVVRGMPL